MAKNAKTGGASRFSAKTKKLAKTQVAAEPASVGDPLSRKVQGKITKRINFLAKVAKNSHDKGVGVSKKKTATEKKNAKKKKLSIALTNLSSLDAALSDAAAAATLKAKTKGDKKHVPSFRSAASRGVLEKQENERLHAIWEAPAYKANPLKALSTFLDSSLPPAPVARPVKKSGADDKKKKKKNKSGSTGMEF